jgi:hypothetical protein
MSDYAKLVSRTANLSSSSGIQAGERLHSDYDDASYRITDIEFRPTEDTTQTNAAYTVTVTYRD